MPYIVPEKRPAIDEAVDSLVAVLKAQGNIAGDLNYAITTLMLKTIEKKSYDNYQNKLGTLFCAGLEFYRREVAPYEDKKAEDNGDVYQTHK